MSNQGIQAIAIGANAGESNQGEYAIAMGYLAGNTSQGGYAIALGANAGNASQGGYAIALGGNAGSLSQGDYAVAMGVNAGTSNQGTQAIAIGATTGYSSQGAYAIAIGNDSGKTDQSGSAIAIGPYAGNVNQGYSAIAIGPYAGYVSQGDYAIAIGRSAGFNYQISGSIILNASMGTLDATNAGFFVNPVRNVAESSPTTAMYYDESTSEIKYGLTVTSDLRLKKNISTTALGLDFINKLRPVEFEWKDRNNISLASPDGDAIVGNSPGVRKHQGLIAQEVKTVLDDLSVDSAIYIRVSDAPPYSGMNGIQGVRYDELITPTIKAVQELYAIVKQQSEQIAQLQFKIQTLETMLSSASTT